MRGEGSRVFRVAGVWLLLPLMSIASVPAVAGEAYPTRPIRLIIPFGAGGGADTVGRLIAKGLSERLGQQVVVDNRSGAGGVIGAELGAKSAPDGHTLTFVPASQTSARLSSEPTRSLTGSRLSTTTRLGVGAVR